MASQGWEICSTWEVDDGGGASLSDHVTVRDVQSSDGAGGLEDACIRLVPGPEKQSCEVTVRFKQQQHAIHCIDVLSTARTCEVYRQNEGDTDAEYLCTARGQLETVKETLVSGVSVKSLYRAEMDLEDPDLCTSVTIRLLSLQDKSHVIIGHILVLVSPGPYLAGGSQSAPAPVHAAVGGGASAASLGAMMPLMLQMAQGFSMPDLKNKMSFISNASAESVSGRVLSQQGGGTAHEELAIRALAVKPGPSPVQSHTPAPHPSPPGKSEALLEDVCQRLERLESVCARIETSLSKTLESFDKRLRILENGTDKPSEN
ncbi:hypothetical protein KC19_5G147100 [Ceratodon purpureus]|uniref:Uncharacterized protein n=1 Tax=Ceratodon purpureus TaxID=3225 RepID=A0A8T0I1K1_CERPU|nr:hypothetical protein KC19_5G147100 [Ceratodon purpureus]